MKQSDKLKELLEELRKLAEETIMYLPILESLDSEEKQPLIKDEKTRKAVRAWAEANDIDEYPSESSVVYNCVEHRLTWLSTCIEFNESTKLENLTDGETYTITELCGEDEE